MARWRPREAHFANLVLGHVALAEGRVTEAARCLIGNGKSALYTDGLYGCLTAPGDGRHVVFVPRSAGRR